MPDKERKKLTVTSVGQTREYNNTPVINFAAADEAGESKGYETWGQELVDLIQKDALLDAEVSYKQKDGQITNRVTQVFDAQGKPIRPTQRRQSGGYGGGNSPEDRVSNENQNRAYIIADLWKAEKIKDDDSLIVKLKSWLARMGESAPAPAQPSQPVQQPTARPAPTKAAVASSKEEPAKAATEEGNFANVGQFLTACNKQFGLDRSATLAVLEVSDPAEILDLKVAWQKISDPRRTDAN